MLHIPRSIILKGVILVCLLPIKIVNADSDLGAWAFETIPAAGMLIFIGWMQKSLKI